MKKVRLTIISTLLAFAMIFAAACGSGNGGTTGGGAGTGTGGGNYAALLGQARQALEAEGFDVHRITAAEWDEEYEPMPAGFIELIGAGDGSFFVDVILFNSNANADAFAAHILNGWIPNIGQNGRIVFLAFDLGGGTGAQMFQIVYDTIGGTILS